MIESISLKFTGKAEPLVVPSQGVTIFVGPNNSGKSLLLREFEAAFASHGTLETKLFCDYELEWPEESQIESDIEKLKKKAPVGIVPENISVGRFRPNGELEASHRSLL
jgi:predicted ATP-dependent endonuclease of OLD family